MNRSIRSRHSLLFALATVVSVVVPLAAVRAADDPAPNGDDNIAIAVNTEDGAAVFEFAFSVRRVVDGTVDETNIAAALASCTDCTTVAVAFQAALVTRDADQVVPVNLALAFNDQCASCFTYTSATQLVFGFGGPVRISSEGRHRLHDLRQALLDLEDRVGDLTRSELVAAVEAAEIEFFSIFSEDVVEVGSRPSPLLDSGSASPTDESASDAVTGDSAADETTTSTAAPNPPAEPTSSTTLPPLPDESVPVEPETTTVPTEPTTLATDSDPATSVPASPPEDSLVPPDTTEVTPPTEPPTETTTPPPDPTDPPATTVPTPSSSLASADG